MIFGILQKALFKELLLTFLAVFIVLLLITFGSEVTRILAQAVKGEVPPEVVLDLMGYKLIRAQDLVMPLVALIAVMLTFGRMHQDHEFVIMQTAGIGPEFFKKTVVVFLIPVTLILYFILLVAYPWSYQNERQLINDALSQSTYTNIEPGKFNALPGGSGVLYAQSVAKDGQMQQIWIRYRTAQNDLILTAESGQLLRENQQMVLKLAHGWRYANLQGPTAESASEVQKFVQFEGVLPQQTIAQKRVRLAEKDMFTLWQATDVPSQVLLHERLSVPLSILVMGLIGLRLSKTGPRQGRFAKLFVALLLFIIYNQLAVSASDLAKEGQPLWLIWLVPWVFLMWALGADRWLYLRLRFLFLAKSSSSRVKASGASDESN